MTSNDNCSSPTLDSAVVVILAQSASRATTCVVVCPIQGAGLETPLWWTCARAIASDGQLIGATSPLWGQVVESPCSMSMARLLRVSVLYACHVTEEALQVTIYLPPLSSSVLL